MKTKERWIPKVGDRCFVYQSGGRFIGTIEQTYDDNKYSVSGFNIPIHRNQLRPIKPPKPKREKMVIWVNIHEKWQPSFHTTKMAADHALHAYSRIRCVKLVEADE